MDDGGIDWERLERYLAGESSPEEAAEVARWLETNPVPDRYVDALKQAMDAKEPRPATWPTDAAWRRLAATTGIEPRPKVAPPLRVVVGASGRRRRWGSRRFLRPVAAAAATVVLVAGSVTLWQTLTPEPAAREFATTRAQRGELRLADGTHVTLGVDTKLRVPTGYGDGMREVHLEGEAHFDVVHDDDRPFIVRAGNAVATDLGTRFGVKAYAGEGEVQVVVAEGAVALSATGAPADDSVTLVAGDLGRLNAAGLTTVVKGVDVDRYLGWTEGRLVFEDTSLRDALPRLERWYDLELELADASLGERRITLSLREQSIIEVLDAIALLLDARYERSDRNVTFHAAGRGER